MCAKREKKPSSTHGLAERDAQLGAQEAWSRRTLTEPVLESCDSRRPASPSQPPRWQLVENTGRTRTVDTVPTVVPDRGAPKAKVRSEPSQGTSSSSNLSQLLHTHQQFAMSRGEHEQ